MVAKAKHNGPKSVQCKHSEIDHCQVHEQHIPCHYEPRKCTTLEEIHLANVPHDEERHVSESIEDVYDGQIDDQDIWHCTQRLEPNK